MTLQHQGECWITEYGFWMEFQRLDCDFCEARVEGETGEVEAAFVHEGWTFWVGGLHVCPECRRRMTAPGDVA